MIDAAMLRPGRLDKLLYVPLPDVGGRTSILRASTRRTPLHSDVNLSQARGFCSTAPALLTMVAVQIAADSRTEGFSGADLASLVREAAVAALRESFVVDDSGQCCHRSLSRLKSVIFVCTLVRLGVSCRGAAPL